MPDANMSIFRNTVWIVKGLREYTSGGFSSAAKGFNQADLDVDCTGKGYMITGEKQKLTQNFICSFCRS